MNPKKAKELVKPTALELELPESVVKDITDFYWSELRKALGELRAPDIYVASIGTFKASGKKLVKIRETYTAILDKSEIDTFKKFSDRKGIETKLSTVENVFSMMRDSIEKKKKVKELRYGKSNLEKSNKGL